MEQDKEIKRLRRESSYEMSSASAFESDSPLGAKRLSSSRLPEVEHKRLSLPCAEPTADVRLLAAVSQTLYV